MSCVVLMSRYPPHGRRASTIETGVTWARLRAPLVDLSPHDLHVSGLLNELQPGDHIEIQWRRNKEFPYGNDQCSSFISCSLTRFSCLLCLHVIGW